MGVRREVLPVIVGILILATVGYSQEVFAVTNISSCQILNIPNETYIFTSNIISNTLFCLHVTADGITIDGDGYDLTGTGSDRGVFVAAKDNVTIKNINFKNFRTGVSLDTADDNIVKDNNFDSNFEGMRFFRGTNNLVENNIVTNSLSNGMAFLSDFNTIRGNTVFSNGGQGIALQTAFDSVITENVVKDNEGNGIQLNNSDRNMVINNESSGNHWGIIGPGGDKNVIRENIVTKNRMDGIAIIGDENIVENNIVNKNQENGITLFRSDQNIVKKNKINNNHVDGIRTAFSNDNLYEDNVINNNGRTGILLQIDTNDEIKSNRINKNFQSGIILSGGSDNTVVDNKLNRNNISGLTIRDSNNNSLSGNEVRTTKGGGVVLERANFNNLDNNKININFGNGIAVLDSSNNNTISNNEAKSNKGDGIKIISSDFNIVDANSAVINGFFGFVDNGFFNIFTDNFCKNNFAGGSDPPGLCAPQTSSRGGNSPSDLANAKARFNTFGGQPSDDITDDKKGGGGDEHLTRPTFGVSHETFETIVDSGFRFNDQSFTINDNFHTPFAQQTVNIGEVNTFEAKIYADKRIKVQEFLFGIPNVGEAHLAELGVEIWYDYNGEIEEVKAVQKSNVIDKETLVATHEKTKCQAIDSEERCDVTNVSMVFLEPLKDKVMAVKAIDYKGRYQITYLNEGVDIAGESLNPMQTYLIPSNIRDQGLIKVTQLAKYSPYWQSDDGRTFEMNSFGSFKEINITFDRFQDTGTAYTRLHSGFGGVMAYELKRATGIFDASELISELPESFAYLFPEAGDRMTEEMKARMLEQEEIAKKIIDESKVQARW